MRGGRLQIQIDNNGQAGQDANESGGNRGSRIGGEVDGKEQAKILIPGRAVGCQHQAVAVENSMKLLQFGASSSFLKSMKLARGGNHDSIVRLRCLFLTDAIFDCCGDCPTRRSEGRGPPLSTFSSIGILLAVMIDNLRLVSGSAVVLREAKESSSSSSSLMLMKFKRPFLGIPTEDDSRPSKQARAAERFTRLVSEVTEREIDEADLDATVLRENPRVRVGESGSGGSVARNDGPAERETMDGESAVEEEMAAFRKVGLRTPPHKLIDPGLRMAERPVVTLDEIKHSTVRG